MTMRADLNKLKSIIRPTTEAEIRESLLAYEKAPVEAGFVPALELDMHAEYLACANAVAQKVASQQAQLPTGFLSSRS
jgi:hypothetical protein